MSRSREIFGIGRDVDVCLTCKRKSLIECEQHALSVPPVYSMASKASQPARNKKLCQENRADWLVKKKDVSSAQQRNQTAHSQRRKPILSLLFFGFCYYYYQRRPDEKDLS